MTKKSTAIVKNGKIVTKYYSTYMTGPLTIKEATQRAQHLKSLSHVVKGKNKRITVDIERMRKRCLDKIKDYYVEGRVAETPDGVYIYKNNKANILAVAHLDTVQDMQHFHYINLGGEPVVFNSQLDDRLGAYIILDLLPEWGLKYDILLTTGEESGRSTALHFTPPEGKEYNWIFEFDRAGTDVVMYQFEDTTTRQTLKKAGFHVGIGSFSDIAYLDHLERKAFNFGCAYYQNHTRFSYVMLREMCAMVARFIDFYAKNVNEVMPHEYDEIDRYWNSLDYWEKAYGADVGSHYSDYRAYEKEGEDDFDYSGRHIFDVGTGVDAHDLDGVVIEHSIHGWEPDCFWCGRPESICNADLCASALESMMVFGSRTWKDRCDYCDADIHESDVYWTGRESELLCNVCGIDLGTELPQLGLVPHNRGR